MTLTEFLLARIAEDERRLSLLRESSLLPRGLSMRKTLNLALRDCDAKRQIVEFHQSWPVLVESAPSFEDEGAPDVGTYALRMSRQIAWLTQQEYVKRFGSEPPSAPMLLALAAVYAEHPDYQQEWAS